MKNIEEKKFKKLFGINKDELSEIVIVSPFFHTKIFSNFLKNKKFFKGIIFHGVNGFYKKQRITYINTGMGQNLIVDSLFALDSSKTKAVIFLGAVGAVKDLKIADKVIIKEAIFDTEYHKKFDIDFKGKDKKIFYPNESLYKFSLKQSEKNKCKLKEVNVASIHTFWDQQEDKAEKLLKDSIQSVDLECALFYAASKLKKINSVALCFVSDNIISHPFWGDFTIFERKNIKESTIQISNLALEICTKLP